MLEISLRSFFTEFNSSKFLVYSTLLIFSLLLMLKLDEIIVINYYFIFLPIWFGNLLVLTGFFIGLISFIIRPPPRLDVACRNDFFAMCFCTLEHILLLMFSFLCCYKLNYSGAIESEQISWLLVFSPLFVQCFMAMIISVWCIRHDKSFEFEMFFSINVVQFVFIAFKLDQTLHWNWAIVFVPIWVMFALFFVGTFYSFIISIFLSRSIHSFNTRRRSHIFLVICYFLLSIPLLVFFILLSSKLDAFDYWFRYHFTAKRFPFTVVGMPLFVTLFFLVFMSFGSKSGNTWWFGMRKPFCCFIFEAFPCMQQYANISYKFGFCNTSHANLDERQIRPENMRLLRSPDDQFMFHNVENSQLASTLKRNLTTHIPSISTDYSIESPD